MIKMSGSHTNNRFVITGGPGSGKTVLIRALQEIGYSGFPEIARELISQGIKPPGAADKQAGSRFFDMILQRRITDHQRLKNSETGFYDRGIPDSLAYFRFQNRRPPRILSEAIETYRYNPVVFAAPPWQEIYTNDVVRREAFDETVILYDLTAAVYREVGYTIVELPKDSINQRLEVIKLYAGCVR